MMRTRDQEYAATIFRQIADDIARRAEPEQKKYGGMAHTLPVLIRTAGLAQALAFVDARSEEPHKKLIVHLATAVGAGTSENLLKRSREDDLGPYMRLTREVLAALLWYKRFAQSVLNVEGGDEGQQPEGVQG